MSFERAQLEHDTREPRYDPVRWHHRERIEALLSDLNAEVESLCDLDDLPCDRVGMREFLELAVGKGSFIW